LRSTMAKNMSARVAGDVGIVWVRRLPSTTAIPNYEMTVAGIWQLCPADICPKAMFNTRTVLFAGAAAVLDVTGCQQ